MNEETNLLIKIARQVRNRTARRRKEERERPPAREKQATYQKKGSLCGGLSLSLSLRSGVRSSKK
jgi:hypothetical protein